MAISTPMLVTFIVYIFWYGIDRVYCPAFDQKLR